MAEQLVHPTPLHIAYAFIGGYIVLFILVGYLIKHRLFISEALVSVTLGVIIGPFVGKLLIPSNWGNQYEISLEFTRIAIGIQVMAAGVSLPKEYIRKEWKSLFFLVGPIMVAMWLVSALGVYLIMSKVSFLEAMAIGACVAPTDPVLANSVVKGRFANDHVPPHLQNILSAESGANDGAGFPFLFLALYLIKYNTGYAIGRWFWNVWAYDILLSIAIGVVAGYCAKRLLKFAEIKKYTDKESFFAYAVALAIFLVGVVSILESDDLLSCFAAGCAFAWDDWFLEKTEEAHFQEIIDNILNLSIFVYIGTIIPWTSFQSTSLDIQVWRLILLSLWVLLLRRLPWVFLLWKWIPSIKTTREAIFAGWFGPMGVGAVFFASLATIELEEVEEYHRLRDIIWPIVAWLILSSVIVHGITVPLLHIGTRMRRIEGSLLLSKKAKRHLEHQRESVDLERRSAEYSRKKSIEIDRYDNQKRKQETESDEKSSSSFENEQLRKRLLRSENRQNSPETQESVGIPPRSFEEDKNNDDEEPVRRGGEIEERAARNIRDKINQSRNMLVYNQGGKMIIEDPTIGSVRVYTPSKEAREEMKKKEKEERTSEEQAKHDRKEKKREELSKSKRVFYESGGQIISEDANGENVIVEDGPELSSSKKLKQSGPISTDEEEEDKGFGFINFLRRSMSKPLGLSSKNPGDEAVIREVERRKNLARQQIAEEALRKSSQNQEEVEMQMVPSEHQRIIEEPNSVQSLLNHAVINIEEDPKRFEKYSSEKTVRFEEPEREEKSALSVSESSDVQEPQPLSGEEMMAVSNENVQSVPFEDTNKQVSQTSEPSQQEGVRTEK